MQRFDLKYKNAPNSFGDKPFSLVRELPNLVNGRDVLELGVGNGRNALYLLENEFNVTGVDSSSQGLKILKGRVGQNTNLKLIHSDVLDFNTDKKFDAVLAIGLLHFLSKEKGEELVKKMQGWTKTGGVNIVAVKMDQNCKNDLPHVFGANELKELYDEKGWQIEKYDEVKLLNKSIAQIIARKR